MRQILTHLWLTDISLILKFTNSVTKVCGPFHSSVIFVVISTFLWQILLLYLVNKVGDPNRKIASKAGHLLGCLGRSKDTMKISCQTRGKNVEKRPWSPVFVFVLVQKHPNMKMVITREVERLLYRPNIALKAQ